MSKKLVKYPVNSSIEKDGKKQQVAVGVAEFFEYSKDEEGLKEAIADFANEGGLVHVMDRFNTQIGTDARNLIRQSAVKGPSLEKLRAEATAFIVKNRMADLQAVVDDAAKTEELFQEVITQLKVQYEQNRDARLAALQAQMNAVEGENNA